MSLPAEPRAEVPSASPSSQDRHRELIELDAAHVWHPFTQMEGWLQEEPLIVERAQGCWLIDDLGRRYLDGVSSLWVTVHGHREPAIDQAIRDQLDRVAHSTLLGLASVPSIQLAKALIDIAPGDLTRVFYSDSGSTSVEIALKMAFQYWRQKRRPEKKHFVALGEAYHGDTLGSVSVGGMELFHEIFRPLLFPVLRVPAPYCYRCPLKKELSTCGIACVSEAEALLDARGSEIAAVIVEPVMQGAAGMIRQPPGYLTRLEAACRRNDVLLICDEVATGFGRTGTMFAVEHDGIRPDLLCLAKGLTGGYLPLAATLATEEIFQAFLGPFESRTTLFHGHTYTGNPLACAAALANLALFESHHTLAGVKALEPILESGLARIARHPHVGEIRRAGVMVGIELVRDRATREEYDYAERIGHQVTLEARRRGAVIRPLGNVLVLMPPLAIPADELRLLLEIVEASLESVTGQAVTRKAAPARG